MGSPMRGRRGKERRGEERRREKRAVVGQRKLPALGGRKMAIGCCSSLSSAISTRSLMSAMLVVT